MNASLIRRPTAIAAALACLSGLAAAQQSGNPAARDEPQVVTVTAQKRSQNLKEVPVAISVVGSEQIEKAGVKDIYDLAKVAPSLDFGDPGTGGPGGSASIRGIGTAVFTSSAESSVGVVVDGVPMGNTMGSGLFDLERVEVLRGPQGTLFGKSASAGVLNMVTKAPVLKRFEGIASVDLASGTAKDVNLRTALNAPLGETAALRVTVHSDRVTGVVHNTFSGKDSVTTDEGGRVRLLVKANADLSLNLIAESDTNIGKNAVFFVPSVATGAALSDFAGCGVTVSLKNNQVCSDDNEYVRNQVQGFSGQLDWTLPNGLTLTSITAWRQHKQGPTSEAIDMSNSWDKIRGTDDRNQKQTTQELRLASPSGSAVEWTSGLFISDYQAIKNGTNTISPNPFLVANFGVPQTIFQPSDYDTHLKSTALFGQATFKLNAETGLIGGLRYTRDRISDSETQTATVSFPHFTPPSTVKHSSAQVSQNNLSGKIGLQYAADATTHTYLTLTRGYKAPQIDNDTPIGALAASGSTTGQVVKAEIPTDLEAGVKTSLLNRKLDVDVALFHNRIKNLQEQVCTLTPIGALSCIPVNVAQVTSQGIEFDLRARTGNGLSFSAGGALILGTTYPAGYVYDGNMVGGQRLLYSAKGKLVLGADYFTSVFGDWGLNSGADLTYKTRVRYCNTLAPECSYKAHAIVGLHATLSHPSDKFDFGLFVRNLSDERVPNAILYPLPGKGAGSGYAHLLGANSFRSVGLTANYRF